MNVKLSALRAHHRRHVLVDNGLFDDLSRIRTTADKQALKLASLLRALDVSTGECPPRRVLSSAARYAVDHLTARLWNASLTPERMPLCDQLAFAPQAVVSAENIFASLCFSLGLEPSFMTRGYAKFASINRQVVAQTLERRNLTQLGEVTDLPVVAATDYRNAFDAGAIYARQNVDRFCLPFGALMADQRSTNQYAGPNGTVALPSSVPLRVLRTVLVARGFMDGWHSARRVRLPQHVHLLGLGQPLLLALVAVVLESVTLVTSDATSPFKASASGTLYTERPVFRRLNTGAVAASLLKQRHGSWDCRCPWCTSQKARQNWREAQAVFSRLNAERQARSLKLRRRDPLGRLLPMLCINPDREALAARIGHNHWVVLRCVAALDSARRRRGELEGLTRRWVAQYPSNGRVNPFQLRYARRLRSCDIWTDPSFSLQPCEETSLPLSVTLAVALLKLTVERLLRRLSCATPSERNRY